MSSEGSNQYTHGTGSSTIPDAISEDVVMQVPHSSSPAGGDEIPVGAKRKDGQSISTSAPGDIVRDTMTEQSVSTIVPAKKKW